MSAVLCGIGGCIPPRIVSNEEIFGDKRRLSDWIERMTGIVERRMVTGGLSTRDLAIEAGTRALASAGNPPIDAVVVATASPDRICPAVAPEVATRLGLGKVAAYDINSACSGFVYGLATASGLIASGIARHVLFIGAEAFSTMVNPNDRNTRPIFGDGAGAVVLRSGHADEDGALGPFDLGSDGELPDLLSIDAGGSRQRSSNGLGHGELAIEDWYLKMDGTKVYGHAVARMTESARCVLGKAGLGYDDVAWFVGHQANVRILNTIGYELGFPSDRIAVNIGKVGNTVTASIPLLLTELAAGGKLAAKDRILISAFGAGLSWGSTVMTWPKLEVRGIEWSESEVSEAQASQTSLTEQS
ncbi:ketoacyl-ACP synthase III [Paraburkholderia nemoris]|uniref:beta-ketoacyl-ACP synthase III n=1 Tax=Paraburkholderia nemoris TaxID=2793076 RepID=UPI0038BB143E